MMNLDLSAVRAVRAEALSTEHNERISIQTTDINGVIFEVNVWLAGSVINRKEKANALAKAINKVFAYASS